MSELNTLSCGGANIRVNENWGIHVSGDPENICVTRFRWSDNSEPDCPFCDRGRAPVSSPNTDSWEDKILTP